MSLNPWIVVGVGVLVVLTAGLALMGVGLVWRSGFVRGWRASRSAPPNCPQCGYNMTGLTECRCPECGQRFSIDQILATVPELDTALWERMKTNNVEG